MNGRSGVKERLNANDLAGTLFSILALAVLTAGTFWVLAPFLPALIWAMMIVIATWPIMCGFEKSLLGKRSLAALVMTLLLVLLFIVPLTAAISVIVRNADEIGAWGYSMPSWTIPEPPKWLDRLPLLGESLTKKWTLFTKGDLELTSRLSPYVVTVLRWFVSQLGGFGMVVVHFLLTVILSAILYLKGEVAAEYLSRFAEKLAKQQGRKVVVLAGQAVRAVALGVVVTALVQSIIAFIGLIIAGVPYPVLLTALIFLLGVIQVGAVPLMLLVIGWLFWSGQPQLGIFMVFWTVLVGGVDNFLRPILIKRGADLPLLLIFAGVLGGLIAWGVIGLFIGPAILAVTYTLFIAWVGKVTD